MRAVVKNRVRVQHLTGLTALSCIGQKVVVGFGLPWDERCSRQAGQQVNALLGRMEEAMSHLLDIDGTFEKLILLQHFVYGSEQYCREQLIGSVHDIGNEALDAYWSWAKSIASSYTLECCIRLRVLLDTLKGRPEAEKIAGLDATARSGRVIGQVLKGDFELTLRETCNKVIHARKVVPEWATGMAGDVEFKYWNGTLDLLGTKGNEKWRLLLHISQWARSVELFLEKAESAELTSYVGQDWY